MKPTSLLLAILFVALFCSISEACPTCKLALEGDPDHSQQGYAYSILFMMSMPFLIALGWTVFIVRTVMHHRKLDAEQQISEEIAFEG